MRSLRKTALLLLMALVTEPSLLAQTATGEVNGQAFVIPNGIDLRAFPEGKPWDSRSIDVLICGLKAPDLAKELHARLADQGRTVHHLTERMSRAEYLALVSDAKITIFLPRAVEGFYLPPLEGMALGTIVICPDCLGNRGFCNDGVNSFRPRNDADEIVLAARIALQQSQGERARMLKNAQETIRKHSIGAEREGFLEIFEKVEALWTS